MTKKLILVAITALGLICSEVSEARVCLTGDPSCDPTAGDYSNNGDCDDSYKVCENPRAGSSYCLKNGQALYKDENCCSALVAGGTYKECRAEDHEVGYGKSCYGGADNIEYWEFCGCAYGFENVENGASTTITDEEGTEIPYETRCMFAGGSTTCQFSLCNEERRFFYENGGDYCKYRLETRCGGFGCMHVYDCDNENLFIL